MSTQNKQKNRDKKSPRKANPVAKYGPRVNRPKIFKVKKFTGPQKEEWE